MSRSWLSLDSAEAPAPSRSQSDRPVGRARGLERPDPARDRAAALAERRTQLFGVPRLRSEEHTSELQSQSNLVCRLLLEKKKNTRCIRKYDVTIELSTHSELALTPSHDN